MIKIKHNPLVYVLDGSGMSREAHVPFCEGLRGKFPRSTHRVPQAHKLTLYGNSGQMCISSLEDGGRPTEVCYRKPASNRLKLLALRVPVVSVEEKLILN